MTDDTQAPNEVTKLAQDLRAVEALAATLDDQAAHRSGDPRLPGGLAMVHLAPVANLEARENIINATKEAGGDLSHLDDEDPEWEPVLQTLLFWTEAWRAEHGNVTDMRPTVATESAYLRQLLNWAWGHEPRFADLAAGIRKARIRLEDTLYAGERVERTEVPCVAEDCLREPRLIRIYGESVAEDHYKCPACRAKYDPTAFARAKLRLLASQGADRFVTIQDAIATIGRPERTVRQWISDGRVVAMCSRLTHQLYVWWPQVRDCGDDQPRRRGRKAA